jgi:outer membrane protein assembly factor BamB
LIVLLAVGPLSAADWPQWQGPERNAISKETGLRTSFPAEFSPVWTFDGCGVGYSAPAIVGGRVYLLGATRRDDAVYEEFAVALDADGKQLWRTTVAEYPEDILLPNWGHGPRGTPSIADGRLFGLGANGDLFALDVATGKPLWQTSLRNKLGGVIMGGKGDPKNVWGYSESPLVDGGRVICTPGGPQGSVAALDAKSGSLLWQSAGLTDPASYTSTVIANFGKAPQYVVLTSKRLAGLRASDGEVLWQVEVPLNEVAIIPTPVIGQGEVYITSDYGAGCSLVKVSQDGGQFKADIVYSNKVMMNHHGGVVLLNGYVYGWTGNSNSRGRWVCQELKTGDEAWTEEKAAKAGSVVAAAGHLYCYTQEDGELVCIEANPAAWKETGRFTIPQRTELKSLLGKVWAHPVISGERLYLRDQNLLFCYDLRAPR